MNIWSWSAFFMRGAGDSRFGTKVLVHFFPAASGVSAPYPVQALIEIFSGGEILDRQGIEGLRINQPDGLDLGDLFLELFSTRMSSGEDAGRAVSPSAERALNARELGITIQLGTTQPRVDLSKSRIIIEVAYPSHHLRYHAVQAGKENVSGLERINLFPVEGFETRLVEINPEPADSDENALPSVSRSGELPGYSLRTTPLERRFLPHAGGFLGRSGFESAGRLPREQEEEAAEGLLDSSVVKFLVHYEPASALPVAVRCI